MKGMTVAVQKIYKTKEGIDVTTAMSTRIKTRNEENDRHLETTTVSGYTGTGYLSLQLRHWREHHDEGERGNPVGNREQQAGRATTEMGDKGGCETTVTT